MHPAPVKPTIPFAQFESLDVRVGTIESVRGGPGSLAGVQTLLVVDLEPHPLAGLVSEAMSFDLGHADGSASE